MLKRVTFMLDDDVQKKLRQVQAKMILDTTRSISFSKVINETLKKIIKK